MSPLGAQLADVLARFLGALESPALAALAVAAALLLVELRVLRSLSERVARMRAVLLATAIAASLVWAWRLAWLCDDAFISFRFADNLVRGHGLVWNPGERVEGYTDFLWTLLMAGAIACRLDPAQASLVVDLGCAAALLWLCDRLARRLSPDGARATLPVAAILLGANYTFASFGTSGMETMPAALAATLALERALARAPLAAGAAGIAATWLHPDHGLLYASLGLALLLERDLRPGPKRVALREITLYALPFFLVYLPYFFWRWRYYGDLFPNTYYAKSGGGAYFTQGAVYLAASFSNANLWGALPLAMYGVWRSRKNLFGRYVAIAVPLYLVYVAKIGCDYMVGRLCVAVLPLMMLSAEIGLCELRAKERPSLAAAGLFLLGVCLLPTPLLAPREVRWYLADERTHTPLRSFAPLAIDSEMFDRAMYFKHHCTDRGLHPRIADTEIGMIGYFTKLEIIDAFGLCDRTVAHSEIVERGRPAHEKRAAESYLISREVDLARYPLYDPPFDRFTVVRVGRSDMAQYFLRRYDPKLLRAMLGEPDVSTIDFKRAFDHYLADILPTLDVAAVQHDLTTFFEPYYFAGNPDPLRRRAFDARLLAPPQ
jgi:hypothetical protein